MRESTYLENSTCHNAEGAVGYVARDAVGGHTEFNISQSRGPGKACVSTKSSPTNSRCSGRWGKHKAQQVVPIGRTVSGHRAPWAMGVTTSGEGVGAYAVMQESQDCVTSADVITQVRYGAFPSPSCDICNVRLYAWCQAQLMLH